MEDNFSTVNEPAVPYGQPLDFQQVWLMFQETNRQFKETDRKIRELDRLFTSQWGKLIESLVEGDLIKLLRERGMKVESILQRQKGNRGGQNFEFDLIAENSTEVVIVEVKTTLRPQDVDEFHEKLWKSKVFLPKYKDMKIYGAVAFLTADGKSDRMAEKLGFFVIKATGSSSSIVNDPDFIPKAF